ncbi:MAG: ABC transporter substrate-binding protein [Candidatus Tectomicrobia bacterium]|nr:ABC transporter substrate-binding protein [Candidatus Tectomicrobia bacterium]
MAPFTRISLLVLLGSVFFGLSVLAEPAKLTVLLPFTGIFSVVGDHAKQGLLLGIQQEALDQSIDWKSWITFEFLDSRADKDHSLHLVKDAIAEGAKAILGSYSSGVALTLRDYILDEAQIPYILFAGTTSTKLRRKHALFLRVSNDSGHYSIPLALWLKDHPFVSKDKPRWACIHGFTGRGSSGSVCDVFKTVYQDVGEEIGRIPIQRKKLNTKKEIAQLAKLKPDFAVGGFAGAEAVVFLRDYFRFKVNENIPLIMPGIAFSSKLMRKHVETLDKYGTGEGVINAQPAVALKSPCAGCR